MAELLLHSLIEFDEIISEIVEQYAPTSILEIGAAQGMMTRRLLELGGGDNIAVMSVEPQPTQQLVELAESNKRLSLFSESSIDFLSRTPCEAELVLIDGDHNYWTVKNELELITDGWKATNRAGIILLHDTGIPFARRDAYYGPSTIPTDAIQQHSFELGVTLDSPQLIEGGFHGNGDFAWALEEGGPGNGVLTAIEDFLKSRGQFEFLSIPLVFGLGAIVTRETRAREIVNSAFAPYNNAINVRLERNRLELYFAVLQLQDLLNQAQAD